MDLYSALLSNTHAKIFCDEPMKKHTSLGVGGKAKFYAEADSLYTLNELICFALEHNLPYKIIGNGTNLLVSDNGFNGLVVCTIKLNDVFFVRDEIRVMAGATIGKVIKFAKENRLAGLEPFCGIPATVGGAIVMNAGAFGHNISEYVSSVETLKNGKLHKYFVNDCGFSYRRSRFLGKKEIIVSANFRLKEGRKETINNSIKTYTELRQSIQPVGRTCGSVFKNPIDSETAGRLIDKCGLKGYSIGGAVISEKHGNFIITKSSATANDVYNLIKHVKEKVKNEFQIELIEEVEFLGEF